MENLMSRVLDKSESHVLINTKNALKVTDNPVIGSTEGLCSNVLFIK